MTPDLEFLSLMYGQEPDEKPKPTSPTGSTVPERGIISLPALSQIVRLQERAIAQLAKALSESERRVQRLENRLSRVERQTMTVGRAMSGMEREIGNKLDKRDWQ